MAGASFHLEASVTRYLHVVVLSAALWVLALRILVLLSSCLLALLVLLSSCLIALLVLVSSCHQAVPYESTLTWCVGRSVPLGTQTSRGK